MLVFGGYTGAAFLDELVSYRPAVNGWTQPAASLRPPARSNHATAWDSTQQRMLVFGGFGPGGYLNDLWAYDPRESTWRLLSPHVPLIDPPFPVPPAREEASAAWDAAHGQLLVFGGTRGGEPLDDLWAYRPATDSWVELVPDESAPVGRMRHSAVWDAGRGEMLVFGGYGGGFPGGYRDDLWSYQPIANRWQQLGPTSGVEAAVGTDEDEDSALTGLAAVNSGSDSVRSTPLARSRHVAVWDAQGGRMLVFGGFAGGIDYLRDLWSYQPATDTWTELTPTQRNAGPTARAWHSAVWDTTNGRLLVFGGHGGGSSDEIWSYRD
jgi:N-acetylneuraminic acid mutarotase